MNLPSPQSPGEERFHFAVVCLVEKHLLRTLRRFVTGVAEEMGFDEEDVMRIEISVDEACSNIVRHAYDPESHPAAPLELELRMDPGALAIRIRDHGRGGYLRGASSLEDYQRPGRPSYQGLGLLIIHQFMDEVTLDARPGLGTTVTMRKFLRESAKFPR